MKFIYIQQFFFFGLLLSVTGVFLTMLGKYLFPVLWAAVIAVVFFGLFQRILKLCKDRASVAAAITVVGVMMVVLLPLTLLGGMVVSESLNLYQSVTNNEEQFDNASLFSRFSEATAYLEPYGITQVAVEERIRDWVALLSQAVASSLVSFSQLTISFFIGTAIMLYLLFFFLRDGSKLTCLLMHYLPLGHEYEERLITRFADTTQAVVKGTMVIALIQGLIGGVLFSAVGISNPVLWGVAMAVLSVIPLFGTAIVWLPAAIVLIATGSVWSGIIILIVGALLIGLIDEFLRPIMVGRSAKMPDAVVLLATIGGLATFGVSGFIIGPIIAALFLALWTIFEERYRSELSNN